jgi:CRISPR system Cascade subunit CasE
MFLTRLRINPARRGARALLVSPQKMHAAVLAGFADPPVGASGSRVLWRVDEDDRHTVRLYVVSPDRPDLSHLVEQAGWPTTEPWQSRPYDGLLQSLAKGQQWAFRLTANPVRSRRRTAESERSQPFGHVTVAQQLGWLTDRAERGGFTIVGNELGEPNLLVHRRRMWRFTRVRGERPVTINAVTFDGVLEVTDPEALRRTLTAGLGRAKGYGCGLLTLAPVG